MPFKNKAKQREYDRIWRRQRRFKEKQQKLAKYIQGDNLVIPLSDIKNLKVVVYKQ